MSMVDEVTIRQILSSRPTLSLSACVTAVVPKRDSGSSTFFVLLPYLPLTKISKFRAYFRDYNLSVNFESVVNSRMHQNW